MAHFFLIKADQLYSYKMEDSDYTSEIIETPVSKVALRADGILHIDLKPNQFFSGTDYKDLMDAAYKIGKGKRFLNLITVGEDTTVDNEGRVFSTSKEGAIYKIADAFVINSLPQKLIGNFYMNFHKPYVPTRFFNSKEEALKWLKSF
jgi:hypothetical protein